MQSNQTCLAHEELKKKIDRILDILEKEGGLRDRLQFLELCQGIVVWVVRIVLGGAIAYALHRWLSGN